MTRRALLISGAPMYTGELMAWAYSRQGGGPYHSWQYRHVRRAVRRWAERIGGDARDGALWRLRDD
jgi:hypothetical protein